MGESEKDDLNTTLQKARSQLDESRSLDGKVEALQLAIEQRDQLVKEKDTEIDIKTAEVESFTENQKRNQKTIHGLEAELKSMSKECVKLKSDMEVARNETLVETDSQLRVQAQLKSEIKEILVENAELRSNERIVEIEKKEIQVKIESLELDNNKLVSKADIITKDFEKEAKEQEAI